MTREEIKEFSGVEPNCFETDREEYWYKIGCIDGLNTADADPDTSSLWHPADEEPECRDGGILCEHDLYYWVATKPYLFTIYGNWHNKVKREHLTRWAYISDLLPKKRDK